MGSAIHHRCEGLLSSGGRREADSFTQQNVSVELHRDFLHFTEMSAKDDSEKELAQFPKHSLSSPNVLEYLTSPTKANTNTNAKDLKIKSTILPGRRARSPSPTPPPYPGYLATAVSRPSNYSLSVREIQKMSETNKYSTPTWLSGQSPVMSSYLGDCAKYPTNRNYGSQINKPKGLPASPKRLERPSTLIPESQFCLSCPPTRLQFSTAKNLKELDPDDPGEVDRDYIGFATLPEQIHRKSVKKGFDFTLMVVGESGLGKSTLVNSLFLNDLYKDRKIPDVSERVEKTTTIEKKSMDIEERGVKLRLTVVDTPGYGDAINGEESWRACCAYIDEQMRQYFQDESGLNRKNIQDNRVHCCIYFVPPYGHGLKQLDLEFMKRLHKKVNIVPVIAKADTLTALEVKKLKERIMADIEDNQIQIYQFPECDSDEDEEFKQQDRELKASVPFAVVGSNLLIDVNGKQVRGRQYPWGIVEVENPKHSDFMKLRNMLICTHMHDLKDITQDVHYENFRAQCISQISKDAIRERSKLKRDSNAQMEGLSETDRLLLEKDEEIRRMQDMLKQMQEKLQTDSNKRDSIVNV